MNLVDAVRREVAAAIGTLGRRSTGTTDDAEKRAIATGVEALRTEWALLERATLLKLAQDDPGELVTRLVRQMGTVSLREMKDKLED